MTGLLRTLVLATLGGVCIGLSGAPLEVTALGFAGPAFLLFAVKREQGRKPTAKNGFVAGLVTATVTNAIALHWVVGLLQDFAGFPLIAAIATALLLWVAQGIVLGLAGAVASALAARGLPAWAVLPPAIVVLFSLSPSLFPWRLAGTQVPWTEWIQIVELGGEPLADLCVAYAGCALAEAWSRSRSVNLARVPKLAVGVAAVVLPLLYGVVRVPQVREAREAAPVLRVGVVQPNVGIWEKRDRSRAWDHLAQLHEMTRELEARGADLVVWPETAYPFPIDRRRSRDSTGPTAILGPGVRGPVLAGALTLGPDGARYNSVVLVGRDRAFLGISDKVQLLAFGEYVPLWDYIPPLQERFHRGLTPGDRPRVLECDGTRIAVLNCYEDVLASYGRDLALEDPGFLVNVTNDAWFGDTSEPWLHQSMARMRSIETRRDLVRAVNTGVSSHTLATGEDAIRTDTWEVAAFVAEVRLLHQETPWVRFGDWLTPMLLGALLGAAFAVRRW